MRIYAVAAALLGLAVGSTSVAMGNPSNDEAGVRALVSRFEGAWNRHDLEALASLFADDVDFVNVVGMRWVGRNAIEQHHAASRAAIFKTSTLKIQDTTVRFLKPDVATACFVWTLSGMTLKNGQIAPTRTGILTHVLVRADGHWLILLSQKTDIAHP
jgi:uncharacterized protein (TIGR02246 family)